VRGTRWRAARTAGVALALALASAMGAACAPGDSDEGEPRRGGTLEVIGKSDVDHLDTAGAYTTWSHSLLRALTRQLVSYRTTTDHAAQTTPVADLAEAVPTPGDGGRTYTFTIREGARWDTPTPRQITAADVVRGVERLCNPVVPVGAPAYFVDVIVGMDKFCKEFARVRPDAKAIKDFVDAKKVEGITALDERTVRFTLVRPTVDFLHILALPFATPVPVEAMQYLPDSPEFRANFVSSGPYRIERYTPRQQYLLTRNPAWQRRTDPIRAAYVDRIRVTLGADEGPVQQQLERGTADMQWDTEVPTAAIPRLEGGKDERLQLVDNGCTDPYVVMNLQSKAAGGALNKVDVRRAINYAVNKRAIIDLAGGLTVQRPLHQILTPAIKGFQRYDHYPTAEDQGDPAKARALLSQAGYPDGITLTFLYRNAGKHPAYARRFQTDLAKAGIRLKLKEAAPSSFYVQFLQNPDARERGEWDLAAPGWCPDWHGNAARSFFGSLLDGRQARQLGSANFSGYSNPEVNALIDRALRAQSENEAAKIWAEADRRVMLDAPWVPITYGKTATFHSSRVRNFIYFPFANNGDFTTVWLAR
jgi:peptide/nickel transport system substrate-binding protein